jgi:CPA2 family monovalent cation:H+ antiporter-2
LVTHLGTILAVVAAVVAVKLVTTGVSVAALGWATGDRALGWGTATATAFMLAQVGEFSFVLERVGRTAGLTPMGLADGAQVFVAATVVLMMATPLLTATGARLAGRLRARAKARAAEAMLEAAPTAAHAAAEALEHHVILAGYGPAARRLAHVLAGAEVPFVIITLSPDGAREAEAEGHRVLRGDASRQHILDEAGLARAKLLVVADDEVEMARRIVAVARPLAPTVRILVRAHDVADADALRAAGADHVVTLEMESIVQLFAEVLRDYDVDAVRIEAYEEVIRAGGYASLRAWAHGDGAARGPAAGRGDAVPTPAPTTPTVAEAAAAPEAPAIAACCLTPDELEHRTVTIHDGSPAARATVADLRLAEHGVTLKALHRDGTPLDRPPGLLRLRPGDDLALAGPADAFTTLAPTFRVPRDEGRGPRDEGRVTSDEERRAKSES